MASETMTKMGRAYGKFLKTQSGGCYNEHESFEVTAGESKNRCDSVINLAFPHEKGVHYGTEICAYV